MSPRALGWALAVAVAACTGAPRSAGPAATARVDLPKSYQYVPAAITVPAGTRVTWTNHDVFTHSVRLLDLGGTNLIMKPGDSVAFTFARPGLVHYDCAFHGQMMKGTVEVTAPK